MLPFGVATGQEVVGKWLPVPGLKRVKLIVVLLVRAHASQVGHVRPQGTQWPLLEPLQPHS